MPIAFKKYKHLIKILKNSKDHRPCFTVLLGAGASKNSGVNTTREMIAEWRKDYDEIHGDGSVKKQYWYERPEEYAALFEQLYDQPSQRREYIESCLAKASPSWGYIYLMNLLRERIFNTVFTTNFDDLLNESCYNFSSDVRPIVCAHDSSVKTIRITTKRPKIIKLHGDFLFDNIKNTTRELETLEGNMREKFRQFAPEYGMIVVGYSGNDRSVMDTISSLLHNEDNFPHGIYWCLLKSDKLSHSVDELCRYPNFHTVVIEGFDEFMAEINDNMELSLPHEISDPYKALKEKFDGLLNYTRTPEENIHPVIANTIKTLSHRFSEHDNLLENLTQDLVLRAPVQFVADIALRQGEYDKAAKILEQCISVQPDSQSIDLSVKCLSRKWNSNLAEAVEKVVTSSPETYIGTLSPENHVRGVSNIVFTYINNREFVASKKICQAFDSMITGASMFHNEDMQFFLINYAQVFAHMNEQIPDNIQNLLQGVYDTTKHPLSKMGAAIVLAYIFRDFKEKYFDEVVQILSDENQDTSGMENWPIFWLLPDEVKGKIRFFQTNKKPEHLPQNDGLQVAGDRVDDFNCS